MIRLIATDIDNTLLDANAEVTGETAKLLQACARRGIAFAVATGRSFHSAEGIAEMIGCPYYALCYNGALIADSSQGEPIFTACLKAELVKEILAFCRQNRLYVQMYENDTIIVEKLDLSRHPDPDLAFAAHKEVGDFSLYPPFPTPKMLLADDPERIPALENELESLFGREACFSQSASHLIEVTPLGIDQGTGLEKLCAHLGIETSECAAFGDNTNDIPLLAAAGLGIAVGNAVEELKNAADIVTAGCRNEGFEEGLRRFVLKTE